MANEASVVLKMQEDITAHLKSIANTSVGCSKEFERLQRKVEDLGKRYEDFNKKSASLSAEALLVKKQMNEAGKAFSKTKDEADRVKFEKLKAQYDELTTASKQYSQAAKDTIKNMNAVNAEAEKIADKAAEHQDAFSKMWESMSGSDVWKSAGSGAGAIDKWTAACEQFSETSKGTRRAMEDVYDQARKLADGGGGKKDGLTKLGRGLAASGVLRDLGASVSNGLGTAFQSAIGQPMATAVSETLSGTISGVAAGAIAGIPGMIAGGVIGTLSGGINAASGIYQQKDDAFKAYYADLYDTVNANTAESLTSGKELAKRRETTRTAFVNELGEERADRLLADIQTTANSTPFLYDELTDLSRTLLSFGTAAEDIIPTLTKVGDAGAAKGLATSDISTVASYLGRMRSSDKATLEYLNPLMERGFSVFEWLAEAKGTDQAGIYDMISKGDLSGKWVSDVILGKFEALYGGMMAEQSKTTEGLESTLQGLKENIQSAGGAAYNASRNVARTADIAAYGGALGEELKLVSAAGSEAQAYSENLRDQYTREALDAVLLGEKTTVYSGEQAARLEEIRGQYQAAQAVWNDENTDRETRMLAAKKMEDLREETEALATALFESSEWSQKLETTEEEQTAAIRENTKGLAAATAAWRTSNWFSIGMAGAGNPLSGTSDSAGWTAPDVKSISGGRAAHELGGSVRRGRSHAYGLRYVPFDGYPALLHQGERVLTAQEARSAGGQRAVNVTVNVTGNTVRSQEDLDALAERFAAAIQERAMLFGG